MQVQFNSESRPIEQTNNNSFEQDRFLKPPVVKKKVKKPQYVPSINEYFDDGEYADDRSPLLDVSNDIEQCSENWPVDPDNQSDILSNMTIKELYFMSNLQGKSKSQILTEVFLVVNMAHLLFVAALCFYKMLVVSGGVSIAEICAYRFGTLCAIEVMKVSCCNLFFCGMFEDSQRDRDSSPRCNEEGQLVEKEPASAWHVGMLYILQAILMTVAFLAV